MGDSSISSGWGHVLPKYVPSTRRTIYVLVCAGLPLWAIAVSATLANTNSVLACGDPLLSFDSTVMNAAAVGVHWSPSTWATAVGPSRMLPLHLASS